MDRDIILQSNLLDIVFDNRNKDYGAYILRKEYNSRMRVAVLLMISVSLVFYFAFLFFNSTSAVIKSTPIFIPPDKNLSGYQQKPKDGNKNIVKAIVHKKTSSNVFPPKIEKNLNISPATPVVIQPSVTGTSDAQIDLPSDVNNSGSGNSGQSQESVPAPVSPKPEKHVVLNDADVMPQYPGGIKALLEFLKKNIHSPEDVEDDVAVRIKFVVDYDGKLESFSVIESGGKSFDNEVVRVLKKMPPWIPGKNNGENVSYIMLFPCGSQKNFNNIGMFNDFNLFI